MGIFNKNDNYKEKYRLEANVKMLKEYLILTRTSPNSVSSFYGKFENIRKWLQLLKNQYASNMPTGMKKLIKQGELIIDDIDTEIKKQMDKLERRNERQIKHFENKTRGFDKIVNGDPEMQEVSDEEVEAKLREIMGQYSNGGRAR